MGKFFTTGARASRALALAVFGALVLAGAAQAAGTGQPGFYTYRTAMLPGLDVGANVATGNLLVRESDLAPSSGSFFVSVDRFYNSLADPNELTHAGPLATDLRSTSRCRGPRPRSLLPTALTPRFPSSRMAATAGRRDSTARSP